MERGISLLGVVLLSVIAWAFSKNRSAIQWKVVASGIACQFAFALLVLKTEPGRIFFTKIGEFANTLLSMTDAGSGFVFGKLTDPSGPWSFLFAFKVLPTIVFFASLTSVLFYLGIIQFVVSGISKVMIRILGTSGAETLCASANIFMGQTEAPLLIKPYIAKLTQSELMVMMVSGFATLSAGIMLVYAGMLKPYLASAAGHLLAASVMSAPAAIVMAKIIVPETEEPQTKGDVQVELPRTESSVVEAAASGASTGMSLALNVAAMLIAFVSLVKLINVCLGVAGLSLEFIFGYAFAPLAFIIGVPQADLLAVGNLLGKNLVINEFIAYKELSDSLGAGSTMSGRSVALCIYALCGFTNLSSVAIQIGGIGSMVESRRSDLAKLGFSALLAATLANLQTAAIVGVLLSDEETRLTVTQTVPPTTPPPPPTASPTP